MGKVRIMCHFYNPFISCMLSTGSFPIRLNEGELLCSISNYQLYTAAIGLQCQMLGSSVKVEIVGHS